MGTHLLNRVLTAAAVAAGLIGVVGCVAGTDERPPAGESAPSGHVELACATCHEGPTSIATHRASVPDGACLAAGCHSDGGPYRATRHGVTFRHRGHGGLDVGAACANCHVHAPGEVRLPGSSDACYLCHADAVSGRDPSACRECHISPTHISLTPDGTAIPHERFARLGVSCTRCHYDAANVETHVDERRCTGCHVEPWTSDADGPPRPQPSPLETLTADPTDRQALHDVHRGLSCTRCHERPVHAIEAMSGVVALDCAICHPGDHEIELTAEEAAEGCHSCHDEVHVDIQRFVLGLADETNAVPSAKFLDGMSCRGCHRGAAPDGVNGAQRAHAVRAGAAECIACHPDGYDRVLEWWQEGIRMRRASLEALINSLRDRGVSAASLDHAEARLAEITVELGVHNLELAHRIFEDVWKAISGADGAEIDPAASDGIARILGPHPRRGTCSHCHYATVRTPALSDMSPSIHARLHGDTE